MSMSVEAELVDLYVDHHTTVLPNSMFHCLGVAGGTAWTRCFRRCDLGHVLDT